jgi:hypothetical protein
VGFWLKNNKEPRQQAVFEYLQQELLDYQVARSLIAGGLSTPFRDASAGVMVLFAVVHLDWLDGAA